MRERRTRTMLTGLLVALPMAALAQPSAPGSAPAPPPAQLRVAALEPRLTTLQAVGPQAGFGDLLVLGTGGRFELPQSTGEGQVPVLDGRQVGVAALAGPWEPGRHAVSLQSVPAAGAEPVTQPPLQFVYDPGAPTLQWEIGTTSLLDVHGLDQGVDREHPPRHVLPERDRHVKILWSPDGRRWLPLLPKNAKPDPRGVLADWLTAADRPQIFLWALGSDTFGRGAPVAPRKLQLVRIWAADELSAVRDLRLRVLPGVAGGGYRLEMVATDLVGNLTTVTWPLAR